MQKTTFRTYELAVEFYRDCALVKAKAHLRDQLERASLSIVLNAVEGAAKPTRADQRKFYAISYGSARECQALLRLLGNDSLFAKADTLGGHLFRLMKSTH